MRSGGNVGSIAHKIIAVMEKMAGKKRAFYGPPMKNKACSISPMELVFNFTEEELDIASKLDNEVSDLKKNILYLMEQKIHEINETKIREYSLIHGELVPEHIFILDNGDIGLIDIEGVKYFDIEYDWALINITYGDMIPLPKSINKEKLEFYKLCRKIIYVSGAIDYLVHVDNKNEWFRNFRESTLSD
jgi:hypothetical protein